MWKIRKYVSDVKQDMAREGYFEDGPKFIASLSANVWSSIVVVIFGLIAVGVVVATVLPTHDIVASQQATIILVLAAVIIIALVAGVLLYSLYRINHGIAMMEQLDHDVRDHYRDAVQKLDFMIDDLDEPEADEADEAGSEVPLPLSAVAAAARADSESSGPSEVAEIVQPNLGDTQEIVVDPDACQILQSVTAAQLSADTREIDVAGVKSVLHDSESIDLECLFLGQVEDLGLPDEKTDEPPETRPVDSESEPETPAEADSTPKDTAQIIDLSERQAELTRSSADAREQYIRLEAEELGVDYRILKRILTIAHAKSYDELNGYYRNMLQGASTDDVIDFQQRQA